MVVSKKIGLAFIVALATICFCMTFSGCPFPPPVPGPPPASADSSVLDVPPDPFRGRNFNCHLPIVASQYMEASSKVKGCLDSPPLACLTGLLGSYAIDTVACLVRDLGFGANNAVLAGTATGNDGTIATNSRVFINAEDLGFQ
jgi:hypothetical protein